MLETIYAALIRRSCIHLKKVFSKSSKLFIWRIWGFVHCKLSIPHLYVRMFLIIILPCKFRKLIFLYSIFFKNMIIIYNKLFNIFQVMASVMAKALPWPPCICGKLNWCSFGWDIPRPPFWKCISRTSSSTRIIPRNLSNGFPTLGKLFISFIYLFVYLSYTVREL